MTSPTTPPPSPETGPLPTLDTVPALTSIAEIILRVGAGLAVIPLTLFILMPWIQERIETSTWTPLVKLREKYDDVDGIEPGCVWFVYFIPATALDVVCVYAVVTGVHLH